METISIDGYGCHVSWDGQTLRAKGTGKASHLALLGPNRDIEANAASIASQTSSTPVAALSAAAMVFTLPEELVLRRDEFTVETFRLGNPFINGSLIVRESDGTKHEMHFRRKDNAAFTRLRGALG